MNYFGSNQSKQSIKIIIVGDSGVGKTCLVNTFFDLPFEQKLNPTIAPAYSCSDITSKDGTVVGLQIWDTAGQEKYNSVSRLFYREANFAFVCFEAGNEKSLENILKWAEKVKTEEPKCKLFCVMTKIDLFKNDKIKEFQIIAEEQYISSIDCVYFTKTSSLKKQGIKELFNKVLDFIPNENAKPMDHIPTEEKKGCSC